MTMTKTSGPAKTAAKAKAPASKSAGNVSSASASQFEASGAPAQTAGIPAGHAALDTDPRADTSADQNRIDFNDPNKSGSEAVAENLADIEKSAVDK